MVEILADVFRDGLIGQLERLRQWLAAIKHSPFGHELSEPVSFQANKLDTQGEPVGQPFRAQAKGIDVSRWQPRYTPRLPTIASARRRGAAHVLEAHTKPDVLRFYKHAATTSLQ